MEKTNKDLIFERMGISSPKFEIKQSVGEANVPNSDGIEQIFEILEQQDYFPMYSPAGIQFVRISEYPQDFESFKTMMRDGWGKISLPF